MLFRSSHGARCDCPAACRAASYPLRAASGRHQHSETAFPRWEYPIRNIATSFRKLLALKCEGLELFSASEHGRRPLGAMDHQAAQGFGSKIWILGLEPSCQSGSSRCRGAGFASPSQGLIWIILIRREQQSVIGCAREERIVVQYMIAA